MCKLICKKKQKQKKKIIFFNTVITTIWSIWLERNDIIFNKDKAPLDLKEDIKALLVTGPTDQTSLKATRQALLH